MLYEPVIIHQTKEWSDSDYRLCAGGVMMLVRAVNSMHQHFVKQNQCSLRTLKGKER
jgi:hypothetical protein